MNFDGTRFPNILESIKIDRELTCAATIHGANPVFINLHLKIYLLALVHFVPIVLLIDDFLNEGYQYTMTSRLQSDPIE